MTNSTTPSARGAKTFLKKMGCRTLNRARISDP
jgi:hypothetical protein